MKHRAICVAISAAALMTGVHGTAQAEDFTGTARAIDGDSLDVGAREVRLFGIDAPEYRQTCKVGFSNWSCGGDAAAALRALVDGRRLSCTSRDRDVYGRTVATCTANGSDVAAEMVGRGLAIVLSGAPADYLRRQADSKAAGTGIWASQFIPPSEYRAAHPRDGSARAASPPHAVTPGRPTAFASAPGMWRSCAQARAAGAAPVHREEPGYNPMLDGDNDGIACEPYRKRR